MKKSASSSPRARAKRRHFMADGPDAEAGLPLAGLRNLGPASARMLAEAGITTREELARCGALGACERLMRAGRPVSLNLAYAIEGALMDHDWRALPFSFRAALVEGFRAAKKNARGRPAR